MTVYNVLLPVAAFGFTGLFFVAFSIRVGKLESSVSKIAVSLAKKDGESAAIHLKISGAQERISVINQRISDAEKNCGEIRFRLKKAGVA